MCWPFATGELVKQVKWFLFFKQFCSDDVHSYTVLSFIQSFIHRSFAAVCRLYPDTGHEGRGVSRSWGDGTRVRREGRHTTLSGLLIMRMKSRCFFLQCVSHSVRREWDVVYWYRGKVFVLVKQIKWVLNFWAFLQMLGQFRGLLGRRPASCVWQQWNHDPSLGPGSCQHTLEGHRRESWRPSKPVHGALEDMVDDWCE